MVTHESLRVNSDLCKVSELYFQFSLFADLAQNHVPLGASLRVALRFPQEEDLKQVFSPLIYGPDLRQSLLVCELHNPLGAVNFVNVDCIVFLNILRLGKRLTRSILCIC